MTVTQVPHDIAEQHTLGSCMHTRKAIEEVTPLLDGGDFFAPRHEVIYAAILALHGRGEAVDPTTVAAELTRRGELAAAGGPLYLAEVHAAPPVTSNVAYYARIVRDQAILRRLHTAGTRIVQLAEQGEGPDADSLVETARAEVDHVSRATAQTTWLADTIDTTIDDLNSDSDLVPTPWVDLDRVIGGWAPGRLYVVGARPGVGKSLLAVNVAAHLARLAPVALSSLEMSRTEIDHRVVALVCGVEHGHLSRHRVTDEDWVKISARIGTVQSLRLAVDDRASATVTDVISHARSVARANDGRLGLIIVDYLQLMSSQAVHRRHENRQTEVAEMSRRLKVAARELNCPVLALSQLNRGVEGRADRRPTLSDLRESGAIEQDADVVMLLHLPDEEDPTGLDLAVMKNRHGPLGTIGLHRDGAHARITGRAWSTGGPR